jgi:hypothetical protein
MARYFMHLIDGTDQLLDPEGAEHASLEILRGRVLACARSIIAHDVQDGVIKLDYRIEAHDEAGEVVHSLDFEDAVQVQRGH